MPNNPPPPMPEWAIDALRELIDIAGLLNDEAFLAVDTFDPRAMVCDRLRSLTEVITLTSGEPSVEEWTEKLSNVLQQEGEEYPSYEVTTPPDES